MTALPELLEPLVREGDEASSPGDAIGAAPQPADAPVPVAAWWQSLASAGVMSVFDQGVVSGTNFLTNLVLIRTLMPAEFGLYALAWSLSFFLRGVQEQIISAPFMVYAPKKEQAEREQYQGSVLAHQLLFALFSSSLVLAGLAVAWTLAAAGVVVLPYGASEVFIALGAVLPLLLLREFARQFAFARLDVRAALGIDLLVAAIQLGMIAALWWTKSVAAVAGLYAIGAASGLAGSAWLALKSEKMTFSFTAIVEAWQENWAFGRWSLATQLLSSTMPYFLPWLLAFSPGGAANSAMLAACTTLVGVANMFVVGVSNSLSHRAIHAYHEHGTAELVAVLRRTAFLFVVTIGLFALAAWLFGQPIADWLFKHKYPDAGPVIAWLALGTLVNSLNITAGNGLWALDRPQSNFAADTVSFLVTLAAAAVCVPLWGAAGAAAATCIGFACATSVRTWTLHAALVEAEQSELVPSELAPAAEGGQS